MSRFEWQKMDIVMFDRELYKIGRNWFGYIYDDQIKMDGSITVRWYDDVLGEWTGVQEVPAAALIFLWRMV